MENLAVDLEIEKSQLHGIIKFYNHYEMVATVSPLLSWSHYIDLIKIENNDERTFYQHKTIANSWSIRELRKQIKSDLYANTPKLEIEAAFQARLFQAKYQTASDTRIRP